ncbi:hypothetical protein D3C78_1526030 [compost metagenome]
MSGRIAVVNLVLGRAVQHMLDYWTERKPHMAVTQVCRQSIEDEHQIGHAEQGITADFPTTGVPEDTCVEAEANGGGQFLDDLFHEVNPARRRRHQDGRRMMDLVERP